MFISGAHPWWVLPARQSRPMQPTQEGWKRKRSPRNRADGGVLPRHRDVCEPRRTPTSAPWAGAGAWDAELSTSPSMARLPSPLQTGEPQNLETAV